MQFSQAEALDKADWQECKETKTANEELKSASA